MSDDDWLDDPTAFRAKMAELIRRSNQSAGEARAAIEKMKMQAARARKEQRAREAETLEAAARELAEEVARFDVRDVEELQIWADRLGYRHGYSNRPLRFSAFHQIMRRKTGNDYPGLDPRYYESYYVGGHKRGEEEAIAQAAYALDHGESRAPNAPLLTRDMDVPSFTL